MKILGNILWLIFGGLKDEFPPGCLRIPLNILWFIFGGLWAWICHVLFGIVLCITIIGIPWGKQHFKMAGLAVTPFGRNVKLNF